MDLSLTGVILAGGRGARLGGVIKPLIERPDGRTLLEGIEQTIRPFVDAVIVSATEPTRAALSRVTDAPMVVDTGDGPASALATVALEVRTPWMLLVGGDHPRPDGDLIAVLSAEMTAAVDIVSCRRDGRDEPLWALYRVDAVRALTIERGDSLRSVLRRLVVRSIDAESSSFDNVNTTEDLTAAGCVLAVQNR